jgi:hypothetical protein
LSYSEKYVPASTSSSSNNDEIHADETLKTLEEYLPKNYLSNYDSFVDAVEMDYDTFKPLGEKIQEYSRENRDGSMENFEIYKVNNDIFHMKKMKENSKELGLHRTRFQISSLESIILVCNFLYCSLLKGLVI